MKNYGKPFRSNSTESKIITLSHNFVGEIILCLREKVENMSDAAKNDNNSEVAFIIEMN